MKKFLSLVLALVMTMSLVTIGAGATEYKDLTDKGEIQYEESVAVLNKLGIITGYEDGSFKPTGALTRGAAAKIIVSLMIGSEAAANLTVSAAPYKDVATTNTFAAVISYCKTAGYINGYTDGTFRPTASLTGYAFAKMLLGALGYDGTVEGFTGSGWTMNVAKLGNKAGLFNDFATAFKGNDGVTREGACLLALNTLKATEVEYVGNTVNVSGKDVNVTVGNNQYSNVYSNNTKINQNIKVGTLTSDGYTLEFGEEHFTDLKLSQTTVTDSYGCPANQWSYKNVKVGTYATTADFTYTAAASGDTSADKVKDMGIKDYTIAANTKVVVNGLTGATISSVNDIPAYTANGTKVMLYTSDTTANQITNVVVIKTQMMKVNSVKSDSVTMKKVESTGVTVSAVEDDDDCYAALKNLKADDYVLVTPLYDSGSYSVDAVAIPTSVTGTISKITTNSSNAVNGLTLAGTAYKMSELWSAEDGNLTASTTLSSKTESTAYVDTYGYVIYVKDVTAANSAIVIDEVYSSLVDGKLVNYAQGWDTDGNALSLNLGTAALPDGLNNTTIQGKTYEYKTTTTNNAEYALVAAASSTLVKTTTNPTYVLAGATKLDLTGAGDGTGDSTQYFDSSVKFIFLSTDSGIGSDVTGVSVKSGVSEVGSSSSKATLQYVLNKAGTKIIAVIVPNDNDAAVTANLMYISKVEGTTSVDNKTVSVFTAYIDGVKTEGCVSSKNNAAIGFYTYSKNDTTGVYTLSAYSQTGKTTSVQMSQTLTNNASNIINETYVVVNGLTLNAKNATVIDLTKSGKNYGSVKDLADDTAVSAYTVSLVYNGSTNTGANTVSYLFVNSRTAGSTGSVAYGNDSVNVSMASATTGTVAVQICEDSTNTVAALAAAKLTEMGYTSVSVVGSIAYATAPNGTAVNLTITSETLYKVTLTLTDNNAAADLSVKLGTTALHTGDVIYAGSTGVTLTVTATGVVSGAGTNATYAAGLVKATATAATLTITAAA